jgi:hypothetical protein
MAKRLVRLTREQGTQEVIPAELTEVLGIQEVI